MSSPKSVRSLRSFVSNIEETMPTKLKGLFMFGIKSLALKPLVSCNSNARSSHLGKRAAAEQSMYRLLHSPMASLLWQAVAKVCPLKDSDVVNVDHSNLDPLAILGFAKQTKRGRAVPVLMQALASTTQGLKKCHPRYQKLKDAYTEWKETVGIDQFSFVIKSLEYLRGLYGVQPKLVFDRGFANKSIIHFLTDCGWVYYLRIREDRWVIHDGEPKLVSEFKMGSYSVGWAGRRMRLVVGTSNRKHPSPWYILTNDKSSSIRKIITYYYHRFEIEESFRDLKSLFRLKYTSLRKWQSLSVVLGFLSLSLICADKAKDLDYSKHTGNPRKQLSYVRQWQESISRHLQATTVRRWGFG
jgi:hypothetical protein